MSQIFIYELELGVDCIMIEEKLSTKPREQPHVWSSYIRIYCIQNHIDDSKQNVRPLAILVLPLKINKGKKFMNHDFMASYLLDH